MGWSDIRDRMNAADPTYQAAWGTFDSNAPQNISPQLLEYIRGGGYNFSPDKKYQLSANYGDTGGLQGYGLYDTVNAAPGVPFWTYDQSGKFTGTKAGSDADDPMMAAIPLAAAIGMGMFLPGAAGGAAAGGAGGVSGLAGGADLSTMYGGLDAGGTLGGGLSGGYGGMSFTASGAPVFGSIESSIPLGQGISYFNGAPVFGAVDTSVMGSGGLGGVIPKAAGSSVMDLLKSGATKAMGAGSGAGGGVLGGSNLMGLGATALGALAGAQGQDASQSSTRAMDPRMDALFYGDLAPKTQGLLASQMPAAQSAGGQMLSVGSGLLNTNRTPDVFGSQFYKGAADDLQRRTQEMLAQNNLATRGDAVMTGGLGGSRQGVAEGLSAGKAADYLQGNLSQLALGQYNADSNRNLQAITLGSGLMNQGLNTQFQPLQNTASVYQPFTGYGTTTNNVQSGGGLMGGLGGALGAAQLSKNMGWW